jgi:hypothetical protein
MAARSAQAAAGNQGWFDAALHELIAILRDDYQGLMNLLGAAGEI